jgi:hypothetical protein
VVFTTSIFYLKLKENDKNDMTFFLFQLFGRCSFPPTSMAPLLTQATPDARLAGLENREPLKVS